MTRSIRIHEFGGADVLKIEDVAIGAPLAEVDWDTVYGSGRRGYSDYPTIPSGGGGVRSTPQMPLLSPTIRSALV
jgi:hypothetical protein